MEYRKRLTKVTAKSKKGRLECVKIFLMKFKYGSNFRQEFQAVLEYERKESDKKHPLV